MVNIISIPKILQKNFEGSPGIRTQDPHLGIGQDTSALSTPPPWEIILVAMKCITLRIHANIKKQL